MVMPHKLWPNGTSGTVVFSSVRSCPATVSDVERDEWNAAAGREWALVETLNEFDISDINHPQFSDYYTTDFVREDRRKIIGTPEVDAAGFVNQMQAWFELGGGAPTFKPVEVVAVSGDRLVAIRISVAFADDRSVEMLHVVMFDQAVRRQQRIVTFDVDARDDAVAELHRLAAELDRAG